MKIDLQKGARQVGNVLGKAAEIGRKAADETREGAQSILARAQEENVKAQIKKYNPVFPSQYEAADFNLPNLVMIVDDVVRKGIEVCKGAIGWRSLQKGVEIFCLYDEAIIYSGLHFIPAAICDTIYYVDPHDRSQFIRLDCYFDKMQESRLAELQHIAYCLGAKRYSVEIYDTSSEKQAASQKVSANVKDASGLVKGTSDTSESRSIEAERSAKRKRLASSEFAGKRPPTLPKLCWFTHDENIQNLIRMRCSGQDEGGIKSYAIEFAGSDFATMGANTAAKIDGVIGRIGAGSNFEMKSHAIKESHHTLRFQVEF